MIFWVWLLCVIICFIIKWSVEWKPGRRRLISCWPGFHSKDRCADRNFGHNFGRKVELWPNFRSQFCAFRSESRLWPNIRSQCCAFRSEWWFVTEFCDRKFGHSAAQDAYRICDRIFGQIRSQKWIVTEKSVAIGRQLAKYFPNSVTDCRSESICDRIFGR